MALNGWVGYEWTNRIESTDGKGGAYHGARVRVSFLYELCISIQRKG